MSELERAIDQLRRGDWQAAHAIVQEDASTQGCWAHGIVHLLEGDRANAAYWYRRARRPLPDAVSIAAEIAALADAVAHGQP